MKTAIARALMTLTDRCLGARRREWALAMWAEFEVAVEAGDQLSFTFGCLFGAWREMPAREEGRFALASHILAVGVIVPLGALMVFSGMRGFPYLDLDPIGGGGPLGGGRAMTSVNVANQAEVPVLAIMTLVLGAGHLYIAWTMLDRDWPRAAIAGRVAAAVMATMLAFTGVLFMCDPCALPQAAAVAAELTAIWLLAHWHGELLDADLSVARACPS